MLYPIFILFCCPFLGSALENKRDESKSNYTVGISEKASNLTSFNFPCHYCSLPAPLSLSCIGLVSPAPALVTWAMMVTITILISVSG